MAHRPSASPISSPLAIHTPAIQEDCVSVQDHEPGALHAPSHSPQEPASHPPLHLPFDLHTFTKHLHKHGQIDSCNKADSHRVRTHIRLRWRERIKHFTFTWFTLTMATAGVAHDLFHVPFRFHGLYALGCTFFLLNLVFFVFNCTMMGLRFYWFPSTFKAAFLHPTESLFIPAFIISIANIMINIVEYGLGNRSGEIGVWLLKTLTIMFWIYVVLAVITSTGIYLIMWSTQTFTLAQMTPIWIFPAYPLLLVGPLAASLSTTMGAHGPAALSMIIGGIMCQGAGFMVSLMIYAAFIYRLMAHKLPAESTRPGMFTSIGPSAFTVSSIIAMGFHFENVVTETFMGDGKLAGQVTKILAIWAGVWLYGLALWFFLVSTFAHWSCVGGHRLTFAMTWYSFVFPNSALITATFNVAIALDNLYPLQIIGCVMTGAIVMAWFFIIFMNVRAVVLKQILWPQKQEDSDEHIWKQQPAMRKRQRALNELETAASVSNPISRMVSHVGTPIRLHRTHTQDVYTGARGE